MSVTSILEFVRSPQYNNNNNTEHKLWLIHQNVPSVSWTGVNVTFVIGPLNLFKYTLDELTVINIAHAE